MINRQSDSQRDATVDARPLSLDHGSSKRQWITASGVFVAIVGFYCVAAVRFPTLFIWATYEDLVGEWMQFWCLVVTLVLSVRLAKSRWRFRWFFVVLAFACFYAAMEEISWGQRIFSFTSPEYFRTGNLQGETNLHNFLTGPYATPLKAFVSYALAAALLGYGMLYPFALRRGWRPATWLNMRGVAAPPLYVAPFFVTASVLEVGPFKFNEGEIAEILVGVALVLMTVQYSFCRRADFGNANPAHDDSSSWPARAVTRVTRRQGVALLLIALLSGATTVAIYTSPTGKARIDRRIKAGVKKFASRYARYEQWSVAAGMYERLLADDPKNVFYLRKLAEIHKKSGDDAAFDRTAQLALSIGLARYEESPRSASANRSLVRTYRMIGEEEKAEFHLQVALDVCTKRVERNPASARAVYSLGKTYSLLGLSGAALEQMSKARRLDPSSRRIRKAYFRARKRIASVQ